jgi:hypothetical protein
MTKLIVAFHNFANATKKLQRRKANSQPSGYKSATLAAKPRKTTEKRTNVSDRTERTTLSIFRLQLVIMGHVQFVPLFRASYASPPLWFTVLLLFSFFYFLPEILFPLKV